MKEYSAMNSQQQRDFIERVAKTAVDDMKKYGILASLKIAQAILESGWGRSGLATIANALYGIKADSRWSGSVFNTQTQEVYDGVNAVTVNANFRAYDSWEQSITDHTAFLTAGTRYAAVIGETCHITACRDIHAAGYATDPDYSNKLIRLIEQHNLTDFDTVTPKGENKVSKKIYIDPGHGGRDPGAVGNGMRESDINLEVARLVGGILENSGVSVNYSRADDNSPASRWQPANTWEADFYISIHVNAAGGTGAETFIAATKPSDRAFALAVNDTYAAEMGLRNRGVKLDTQTHIGSLGALRNARMPAILIELAFIDSPANNPDVNILRDRRGDMAQALAKGILQFMNISPSNSEIMPDIPPAQSALKFNVGDIVQFTGGGVFVSSTAAIPAHSRGRSRCKVTAINNKRNPYHLISEDGAGVQGWVGAVDVEAITPSQISKDSRVKIRPGATYFDGRAIPSWVLSDTWIVSSRNGDRVVLGSNVSGKNNINSPINVNNLILA
jgi:N-acetylmuramoyl-L-alanine amidase